MGPLVSMETSGPFNRIKQKILVYESKCMLLVSFVSSKIWIPAHCFWHLCIVLGWPIPIKLSSYYLRWHPCQTIKTNPCINLCSGAFCLCVSSFHRIRSHPQIWFEARRLRKGMELHQSPLINLYFASLVPLLNCLGCWIGKRNAAENMSASVTDGRLLQVWDNTLISDCQVFVFLLNTTKEV